MGCGRPRQSNGHLSTKSGRVNGLALFEVSQSRRAVRSQLLQSPGLMKARIQGHEQPAAKQFDN